MGNRIFCLQRRRYHTHSSCYCTYCHHIQDYPGKKSSLNPTSLFLSKHLLLLYHPGRLAFNIVSKINKRILKRRDSERIYNTFLRKSNHPFNWIVCLVFDFVHRPGYSNSYRFRYYYSHPATPCCDFFGSEKD